MQTLELMDCRALTLSRWPHDAAALREMYLHGCNFLTNQAASALIKVCGKSLQKVTLTEAVSLDSQILRDLAVHSVKLVELCISNCNMVRVSDVETFTNALWGSLRSLDLSSCRGISSFPDSTSLPYLQVLILDKTTINDDGLRAIAHVAPSLKYLSLQDCRMISDDGLAAIASSGDPEGCSNLELVDLKGTPVTDASIQTLETQCPELRLVRVDSCRSVSRKTRQKYYERALRMGSGGPVCKLELLFAEKKRREMVNQKTIDSDSDEECEDYQDEDDSAM